jgi:hypothetical protein
MFLKKTDGFIKKHQLVSHIQMFFYFYFNNFCSSAGFFLSYLTIPPGYHPQDGNLPPGNVLVSFLFFECLWLMECKFSTPS